MEAVMRIYGLPHANERTQRHRNDATYQRPVSMTASVVSLMGLLAFRREENTSA